MRYAVLFACVSLLPFWVGCGDEDKPVAKPPVATPPAVEAPPSDPEEALLWIRAARIMPDKAELRRRLDAWPLEHEDFMGGEETQVVLSWRIRTALQDGEIETALAQWKLLLQHYDGHGVTPEGRGLTPEMIRLGLIEEARLLTRRRVEGAKPDRSAALWAWKIGAELLTPDRQEEATRLERTRKWAAYDGMQQWLDALGLKPGRRLGHSAPSGVEAEWPFVVVIADGYALGETILANVFERWLREGKDAGLRVVLVPILRGDIRVGVRRVPVGSEAEEQEALAEQAAAIGMTLASDPKNGLLAKPLTRGNAMAKAMGLERQELAILIVDTRGRLVGRLSGTGVDARVLDPVIQKLISR